MAQHDGSPRPAGSAGQEAQGQRTSSGQELGRSFEAQTSSAYGGDLGRAFEEHNSSREEWEQERYRTRRTIYWIGGLGVAVALILIIFLTTKPKAGAGGAAGAGGGGRRNQGPAAITVGKSATGDSPVYVNALGTVTPIYTVTVYSQITGRVIAVHYREGEIVRKGQPLVDIDPAPYLAQLKQAEGTLLQAEGSLKQARATLAEAQMDLKRYQDAFSKNAIARQQVEDQEKLVEQYQGTVQADEGNVKADEGNVDYDKVQLSYAHIVAPVGGKVGLRLVDPGNTVFSGTGSTLVVITQLAPITAVFNVAEDNLPEIQQQLKGNKLSVDLFDRSDDKKLASGTLSSLDNQIDTTTGTLKFRATVPNSDYSLVPNQFVNARLLVKMLNNVVQVPSSAIQQNGTQAFVYLVKPAPPGAAAKQQQSTSEKSGGGNKSAGPSAAAPASKGPSVQVSVQNVTVLTSNENVTAVTGLQAGQQVATSGFDRLENGATAVVQQGKGGPKAGAASNGEGTPTTGSESKGSTSSTGGAGNGDSSGGQGGK